MSRAATSITGRIPNEEFLRAFPFYFAWDEKDCLVEAGPSLVKVCPQAAPGVRVQELFTSVRPAGEFSGAVARSIPDHLLLLTCRQTQCMLRGQVISLEEPRMGIMLATPWLSDPDQVEVLNLTMADFAVHDQTLDLLQVLQTQRMAAEDLIKLNKRLTEQRTRLHEQEAISRKLALVAARTDNAVVVTDAQGRIEWVNEGFTRMTGWKLDEIIGKKPGTFLQGPGTDPATVRLISSSLREHSGVKVEILNYHRSGRTYWSALEIQPIRNEVGEVVNFMAIESDITQRRLDEKRRRLEYGASRILTEPGSMRGVCARVIQKICQQLGWPAGFLWMLDVDEKTLRLAELWHDPTQDISALVALKKAATFTAGEGTPGLVLQEAQTQWTRDLARHTDDPRAVCALTCGLRGCIGFPIISGGQVLGVVELFAGEIMEPDEALQQALSSIGSQMGQFIVRKSSEEQLGRSNALMKAVLHGAAHTIISTTPEGIIVTFNQASSPPAPRTLATSAALPRALPPSASPRLLTAPMVTAASSPSPPASTSPRPSPPKASTTSPQSASRPPASFAMATSAAASSSPTKAGSGPGPATPAAKSPTASTPSSASTASSCPPTSNSSPTSNIPRSRPRPGKNGLPPISTTLLSQGPGARASEPAAGGKHPHAGKWLPACGKHEHPEMRRWRTGG
jgi:PAS domain S-box-containing protein